MTSCGEQEPIEVEENEVGQDRFSRSGKISITKLSTGVFITTFKQG